MVLTQLVLQKMNFKAELGVDMQLHAKAKAASKPEFGLESTDFQLGLFDSLSPQDQEGMLKEISSPDSAAKQLKAIRDAWSAGNAGTLDSLLNSSMKNSPGVFAALITNRNRSWIPKLESLIKGLDFPVPYIQTIRSFIWSMFSSGTGASAFTSFNRLGRPI